MSQISHRGQILPLENQLIPISKNTVFHANFNQGLDGFNQGERIAPTGYSTALRFDGADDYIDVGDRDAFSFPNNQFCFEFWMKADDITSTLGVLGKRGTGWEYSIHGTGNLTFYMWTSGGLNNGVVTTSYDTKWTHFAWGCDGTTIYLYKNGTQVASAPKGASTMSNTIAPFEIGRGGASDVIRYMKGSLSDVRVWNYMRTPAQIQENMNAVLRGNETGLISHWKLNEAASIITNDNSMNSHDGLIKGGAIWSEGRTVATLRSDGRFGGAVAVEEPTTNLLVNPSFDTGDLSGWSKGCINANANYTVVYDDNRKGNIFKFERTSAVDSQTACLTQAFSVVGGATYTLSLYAKIPLGLIGAMNLHDSTNAQSSSINLVGTGEWKKYVHTRTFPANTILGIVYLYSHAGYGIQYFDDVQVEQRAFATSFTPASRSLTNLMYPATPIQMSPEGTVAMWYKPTNLNTGYQSIMRAGTWGGDNEGWAIVKNSGSNLVYFEYGKASTVVYTVAIDEDILAVDKWMFIVATWSPTQNALYMFREDGVKGKKVVASSSMPLNYTFPLAIGREPQHDLNVGNALFSEIRIERRAVSEDEIVAWYHGSGHYNYLDYTGAGY